MEVEMKLEGDVFGHAIYVDGKHSSWHIGSIDNASIFWCKQLILKRGEGGTITYPDWRDDPVVVEVEPCPTNHGNIGDDFMGGSFCRDCKAHW